MLSCDHVLCVVCTVKERMRPVPTKVFTLHVQDMHANKDSKFEQEYEVCDTVSDHTHHCDITVWLLPVTRERCVGIL